MSVAVEPTRWEKVSSKLETCSRCGRGFLYVFVNPLNPSERLCGDCRAQLHGRF